MCKNNHAIILAAFLALMTMCLLWCAPGCKSGSVDKLQSQIDTFNKEAKEFNDLFTASKEQLDRFVGLVEPVVDKAKESLGQGGVAIPDATPPSASTDNPDSTEPSSLSSFRLHDGFKCNLSNPENILKSASVKGGRISFSYDKYSWPESPKEEGCNAVACMFLKQADGSWYGGKFDWIRTGGQSVKDTKNITGGYGVWSTIQPKAGDEVAFIWCRVDGKGCSNPVFCTWSN